MEGSYNTDISKLYLEVIAPKFELNSVEIPKFNYN